MNARYNLPKITTVALLVGSATAYAADTRFDADGLRVRSDDKRVELDLGGRLQLDSAKFDDDVTAMDDNSDIRRARVDARLKFDDTWLARIDYDVAGTSTGWKSTFIQYLGFHDTKITAGNQLVPFSLEEQTSSNDTTFMERALPNALSPGLLTGVAVNYHGQWWTVAGGAFGDELGNDDKRREKGEGAALRLTAAPWHQGHSVLHLGIASEYRSASDDSVRFRARPESYLTDVRLVDTRTILDVDSTVTTGFEAAVVAGPFSLQGEYTLADVQRNNTGDATLNGWYTFGSVFLTGESRRYSRSTGAFQSIKPKRNWGAIEIAARYSELDLSDANVTGGKENNTTVGINWYINSNFRAMFNYVEYDAQPNKNGIDESGKIYQVRLQAAL